MTTTHAGRRRPRRGAILLVVITLLALFAVIGLSFVLYAESAATSSRIHRESLNYASPPPNFDDAANGFLRQLIYPNDPRLDPNNPNSPPNPDYLLSALTGHELGRLMYGNNLQEANDVPYNGVGLFHEDLTIPGLPTTPPNRPKRAEVVNHTLYRHNPADPATWSVVDPEYTTGTGFVRTGLQRSDTIRDFARTSLLTNSTPPSVTPAPPPYTYVGKNAPYTYPDRNNLAVALVNPTTGQVIVPSFHRPTLFSRRFDGTPVPGSGSDLAQYDPNTGTGNPNWFAPSGRFKLVRPRPIDQLTATEYAALPGGLPQDTNNPPPQLVQYVSQTSKFPYPPANPDGTITGDVQNLRYSDGRQRNDSVWLDLNLPTYRTSGGGWKQYSKGIAPLVAAIVIPMDGKINLNVAGNLRGGTAPNLSHVSNMGFGPHEINPAKVLANTYYTTTLSADINQALVGQQLAGTRYSGTKTNNAQVPAWPNSTLTRKPFQPDPNAPATGEFRPPTYAQVDWSGTAAANLPMGVTQPFNLPGQDTTNTNSGFQSQPTYYGYYNSDAQMPPFPFPAVQSTNHPLLFNPYTRSAFGLGASGSPQPGVYPNADIRRMDGRYSDRSTALSLTYLAGTNGFPVPFGGSTPPSLSPSLAATGPGMPGNVTRQLTTPYSNHLNRPGLAPNYLTTGTYQYDPIAKVGIPYPTLAGPPPFDLTTPPVANPATDLAATASVRNQRAALSAVDLNRPLADYRTNPTQPLSNTNFVQRTATGVPTQPEIDRQQLCRDIFRRLVVATGANVAFDDTPGPGYGYPLNLVPPTGPMSNPTPAQYNALRWLAQLAANIVDYIDNDDVSTPFVWNPNRPTVGPVPAYFEYDSGNFTATGTPSPLSQRVVFGTEKPRLVLNEVYAELANAPNDKSSPAKKPLKVRFFVELLNPGNTETNTAAPLGGPDTAGAVPLRYPTVADPTKYTPVYRIQVFDAARTILADPSNGLNTADNVLGQVPTALATPKIDCALGTGVAPAGDINNQASSLADYVEANNGRATAASSDITNADRNGFAVVGPPLDPNSSNQSLDPAHTQKTDLFSKLLVKPTPATAPPPGTPWDAMEYEPSAVPPADDTAITDLLDKTLNKDPSRHAVLLRRLANPYLDFNDSPDSMSHDPNKPVNLYQTVDYVTQVHVNDGVDAHSAGPHNGAAKDKNDAIGRVQPYAGYQNPIGTSALDAPKPLYKYDTSALTKDLTMVLKQVGDTTTGVTQKTSLFRHNARALNPTAPVAPNTAVPNTADPTNGDTLLAPFQWLVHLDRPLVNATELLHVSQGRPHDLTHQFGRPLANGTAAKIANFHRHDLQHPKIDDPASTAMNPLPPLDPAGPLYADNSPLYRALELLTVKPWTHSVPAGGRTPGKVNVNMIWDEYQNPRVNKPSSRVLEAVLDPKEATNPPTPSPNAFTETDVADIWAAIKAARSPGFKPTRSVEKWVGPTREEVGPNPSQPVDPSDSTVGPDRPIRGFGGGLFAGGKNLAGTGTDTVTGLEDTLLRMRLTADSDGVTRPLLAIPRAADTNGSMLHPYQQWEPLRKALNNLTTVTDTYLVIYTVGYFEVREEDTSVSPPRRVLGAEAYDRMPGDLRAQYVGVIDRSMMGTSAGTTGVTPSGGQASGEWFTEVAVPPTRVNSKAPPAKDDPHYLRFYVTGYSAAGPSTPEQVEVQYEGQKYFIQAGTQLRLGQGGSTGLSKGTPPPPPLTPVGNAEVVTVQGFGVTSLDGVNGSNLPAFDPATGLATVTLKPMAGASPMAGYPLYPHRPGEPMSGLFSPANPGAQQGFDRTAPQYQGVVPYHSRLYPTGP